MFIGTFCALLLYSHFIIIAEDRFMEGGGLGPEKEKNYRMFQAQVQGVMTFGE